MGKELYQCRGETKKGGRCKRMIQSEDGLCKTHRICHVCYETNPSVLVCGHSVHVDCIIKSGKDTCPICRQKVSLEQEQLEEMNTYHQKYAREFEEETADQLIQENLSQAFILHLIQSLDMDNLGILFMDLLAQEEDESSSSVEVDFVL